MSDETMCYVGMKPCGCCVAAAVDKPEYVKDTAKTVAKWMRDGLTIERKPVQWARENISACKHKAKQPRGSPTISLNRKDESNGYQ